MAYIQDRGYTLTGTLASAVANAGTVTVGYPTGSTQSSFNAGLVGSNGYVMINGNDKWAVSASKAAFTFNSGDITVTNNSGETWPAGSTFFINFDQVDNNGATTMTFPINLASITAAGDVVTEIRPGVAGTIENVEFVVSVPVTTASRAATLNLEIDTTNVTGGTVALTSANCTPIGARIQGAAITAANTLTRDSKLSVEAASVTAFAEGQGYLMVRIRRVVD